MEVVRVAVVAVFGFILVAVTSVEGWRRCDPPCQTRVHGMAQGIQVPVQQR